MEDKVCPLSMAGTPTDCYREECMGYSNGECFIKDATLSLYFIAKNMRDKKPNRS